MTTRRLPRLLKECLDGEALAPGDALLLSSVEGDEFTALLRTAAELRDRHKGRTVTFSPKVFIPLTNLCRDFCGYCTFRKAPGEEGARTLTLDEVLETVRRAGTMGCTEVLFSLGDKPEAIYPEMREFLRQAGYRRTLEYLYDACRTVLEETGLLPHANPGLMARGDLERLRQVNVSMGLMLENVSERLMEPGGPHADAPDKKPSARLRTLAEAGRLCIPVHHRDPHRHRRDLGGADRVPVRHRGAAAALRPYSGSDRAELSCEARDPHARSSPAGLRRGVQDHRSGAPDPGRRHEYSGATQSDPGML